MHFQQKTIIAVACISGAGDTKPVQRVIGLDPCMISKQTKEQEITDLQRGPLPFGDSPHPLLLQ